MQPKPARVTRCSHHLPQARTRPDPPRSQPLKIRPFLRSNHPLSNPHTPSHSQELDLTYNRIHAIPEHACLPSLRRLHLRCQGGGGSLALPACLVPRCAGLRHLCLFPGCKPVPLTMPGPACASVEPVFEGNQLRDWKVQVKRLPAGREADALARLGETLGFLSARTRGGIYCAGIVST